MVDMKRSSLEAEAELFRAVAGQLPAVDISRPPVTRLERFHAWCEHHCPQLTENVLDNLSESRSVLQRWVFRNRRDS